MRRLRCQSVLVCALGLFATSSQAQMAIKGQLLLHDDFRTLPEYTKEFQPLKPGWRARAWHCVWKPTAEGIESLWETGHNPVLAYEGSFSNVVIELDFRYRDEPGKNAYLRINPTNLQLDPRAYSVSA